MADLYIDKDALGLAPVLRAAGHRVTTVRELALDTAHDELHLLTASRRNQVLITHNWRDFFMLHRAWQLWTQDWGVTPRHSGILVLEQKTDRAIVASELLALLQSGHPLENNLHRWRRSTGWEHFHTHE